jgi:uncharacterized protein
MSVPAAALEVLGEDEDIVAAYLFGSRAEGVERPDSDWDFAVLWSDAVASTDRFRRRMRLMETLAHRLGCRVDVVDLRTAAVLLAVHAVRGELLFERDPAVRSLFEMRIRSREDDELIALRWRRAAQTSSS